ncbi:MAG: AzlD domain-containing protein [Halieaceae bacterium]|nr:AzlD domain-containing protein [Halieaceae bacterium]MCP5147737.1 AzlD domain-containing protein [Pseudomonadales bacterium]MCP5167449.1 AzlD domain-containing protein [Pseudomonadales bacterium]MCP5186977.1 AzlD domain-containing protein [Pseudomonadales bacterium]
MNIWLLIAMMALVTYLPRYLPMALAGRVRLPAPLGQALDFVPIAVLTAIIAQGALVRGGAVDFSLGNLHALAALAAFGAALLWRRLFVTIAVGLGCFVLLRLLL